MATDVLTDLGDGPFVYREFGNKIGVLAGPYCIPRMITPGLSGYDLGLFDAAWLDLPPSASGTGSYFVRIVPFYSGLATPAGDVLLGPAKVANENAGSSFVFTPLPSNFACDGYRIYASETEDGVFYFQGDLIGRNNTSFVVPDTWDPEFQSTAAAAMPDTQVMGPPKFAAAMEVYQSEGSVDSRLFLGGGKSYSEGYAKIKNVEGEAGLYCGKDNEDDFSVWEAITDGEFSITLDGIKFNFTGIDFTGDTDMDDVAATIQSAINDYAETGLTSGASVEDDPAVWQAAHPGSLDIVIDGVRKHVYDIDLSAVASMSDVADAIQAGMRKYGIAVLVTWTNGRLRFIDDPTFEPAEVLTGGDFATPADWTLENWGQGVSGGDWEITGGKAQHFTFYYANMFYQLTDVILCNNRWLLSADITLTPASNPTTKPYISFRMMPSVPSSETGMVYFQWGYTQALARIGATIDLDYPIHCTATSRSNNLSRNFCVVKDVAGTLGSVYIDNLSLKAVRSVFIPSYLEENSLGFSDLVGSFGVANHDLSELSGCREEDGATFNRSYKQCQDLVVTFEDGIFVFRFPDTGSSHTLSFLSVAQGGGTDISGVGFLDGLSTSLTARLVTGSDLAIRSVDGAGTVWGSWAAGCKIRFEDEGVDYLIRWVSGTHELLLDGVYEGSLAGQWLEYQITPYNNQVYVSNLGNPFRFDPQDIIRLPTEDSDGIVSINAIGRNIAVFMQHHLWIMDGVDISSPRLVSSVYGVPSPKCVIEHGGGLAFFTGEEFLYLNGGRVSDLDPDGRSREIVSRLSVNAPTPHGVSYSTPEGKVLVWWVGLDGADFITHAVVFDPNTGNFWTYNHLGMNCSGILRDVNDVAYLVTGSEAKQVTSTASRPAFTWLHSFDYVNDGSGTPGAANVIDGLWNTHPAAGAVTKTITQGFVKTGNTGSSITEWAAVTTGYFRIEIDGVIYDVGPCDFTGVTTYAEIATVLQTALRAATSKTETVVAVEDTAYTPSRYYFTITGYVSATTASTPSYIRPYYPDSTAVSLESSTYMHGEEGDLRSYSLGMNWVTIKAKDISGNAAVLDSGIIGCYCYVCRSNYRDGLYGLVAARVGQNITLWVEDASEWPDYVDPTAAGAAAAGITGWLWFVGGIVPSWSKWFDFGSPQHKQKVVAVTVTVDPNEEATNNTLALHFRQDLNTTVRVTKTVALGGSASTVNTLKPLDKASTQFGLEIIRPGVRHGFQLEDITITHNPVV